MREQNVLRYSGSIDLEGDSDRANHVICLLALSLRLTTNDDLLTTLRPASGTGKLRRYGVDA